jgi:hypothetical protein
MKKSMATFLSIAVATWLMTACTSSNKQPADQAITAADNALAAADDAKKYMPEQYNDVLLKLNALKVAYNKGKFDEVVAGAPAVQTSIQGLADALAAQKEKDNQQYAEEWKTVSESVPKVIGEVEHQGELLEKSKKPPEGVDFPSARRYVQEAQNMWKQAKLAGDDGKYEAAVITAKKAQQRAETAARYLRVAVPKG